jgi:intracellular sulfur oxidation DsrE/DsrF family protein
MRRRFLSLGLMAAGAAVTRVAAAETPKHRLLLHVGSPDPVQMHIALGNIVNAKAAYAKRGETVAIELVADAGGYTMLRADKSPVKDGIADIRQRFPDVVFAACQNSRAGQAAAEGKQPADIPELEGVTDVPAGIVRIADLEEQGWSYIRV